MTQDEFEKLRARLEEQLRLDVEMLYEAHRVKLRAFETIRQARAELEGSERPPVSSAERRAPPVLTLRAAPPVPAAPPVRTRGEAWSVLNGVEEALAQLPEEFDKNDLVRALGYEPSRATLFRAFDTLRADGILQLVRQGSGRQPSRFRKLPGATLLEPRNAAETERAAESGSSSTSPDSRDTAQPT